MNSQPLFAHSSLNQHNTKMILWKCATAAAFSTSIASNSVSAFQPSHPSRSTLLKQSRRAHVQPSTKNTRNPIDSSNCIANHPIATHFEAGNMLFKSSYNHFPNLSTSRLYFSSSNDNDKDKSTLGKAASKIKSFLPSFLQDKKTRESKLAKKKAKDNISTGIDTMLKDAPLGFRLMGKMIAPIIGQVAGTMAAQMEEQSRQMEELLDDARGYIVQDISAAQALGEPIEVGQPFSQSSSSMSVNGKTRSTIRAEFEVRGNFGSGVATMDASDGSISSLKLVVNKGYLNINVSGKPKMNNGTSSSSGYKSSQGGLGKNRNIDEDDIIDAEFVEKVKK